MCLLIIAEEYSSTKQGLVCYKTVTAPYQIVKANLWLSSQPYPVIDHLWERNWWEKFIYFIYLTNTYVAFTMCRAQPSSSQILAHSSDENPSLF